MRRFDISEFNSPVDICAYIKNSEKEFKMLTNEELQHLCFVNKSWRLKPQGVDLFREFFNLYELTVPELLIINSKFIIAQNDIFNGPWALGIGRDMKLYVANEELYMELILMNSNIVGYIKKFFDKNS